MDAARLTGLLSYCHLTEYAGDAEVEAEVERLYLSATEYLANAGVNAPTAASPLYDLCVNSLVLQWYDDMRRGDAVGDTEPPGFRRLLNQLKIRSLVSNLNTATENGV